MQREAAALPDRVTVTDRVNSFQLGLEMDRALHRTQRLDCQRRDWRQTDGCELVTDEPVALLTLPAGTGLLPVVRAMRST